MRRVDGIFHRLQPIAVELRQGAQPVPSIGARPDIVLGHFRRRQRSHIGPIKAGEFFYRIGLVLDRKAKFAFRRFRRGFKTITFGIEKPAMVRAGDAALFDAPVGE